MRNLRVEAHRAALMVVDVQERLWNAMDLIEREAALRNIGILIEFARRLALPVILSEQYPRGLGPTIPPLLALLGVDLAIHRLEKIEFGCTHAPGWDEISARVSRDQFIVCGMETHICVYQTARGLAGRGASAHVASDAVLSRSPDNKRVGLGLIAEAGGIVTSTEAVVFDALVRGGSDDFRSLSKLMR